MLNVFQYLFIRRFRNLLELLFHLPLIKQYLIVLFGRVQSLILFALQILFAMLRATSSFGLRPHTLSQNNTQLFCSAEYKIRKFRTTHRVVTEPLIYGLPQICDKNTLNDNLKITYKYYFPVKNFIILSKIEGGLVTISTALS